MLELKTMRAVSWVVCVCLLAVLLTYSWVALMIASLSVIAAVCGCVADCAIMLRREREQRELTSGERP